MMHHSNSTTMTPQNCNAETKREYVYVFTKYACEDFEVKKQFIWFHWKWQLDDTSLQTARHHLQNHINFYCHFHTFPIILSLKRVVMITINVTVTRKCHSNSRERHQRLLLFPLIIPLNIGTSKQWIIWSLKIHLVMTCRFIPKT